MTTGQTISSFIMYGLLLPGLYEAVWKAQQRLMKISAEKLPNGLSLVPDEPLPWKHGHRSVGSPHVYGMTQWGDLFTNRQKLAMITLCKVIGDLTKDNFTMHEIAGLALSRFLEAVQKLNYLGSF